MKLCTTIAAVIMVTGLGACAAGRKGAEAPPPAAPAASRFNDQPSYPGQPAIASEGPAAPPSAPTTPAAALHQASTDIEASQRELDVAGGDCRNACRALGSMDHAAGRLCTLAQSNDEVRRCSEAKIRVYSARDKVRNTCGSCPDVSVDRNAPIPSR